jgi:hypothetical protein
MEPTGSPETSVSNHPGKARFEFNRGGILRYRKVIVSFDRLYIETVECNDMQEAMEKTHLATRE